MNYKVSSTVIRRLPRYIRKLDWLIAQKVEKVSSGELGKQMGLTASQIRQDFNCFGGFGQQGYGYNVRQLRDNIAAILGMEQRLTAIIIGSGHLGHALISNFHFDTRGVELTAAFDVAPGVVGTEIAGTKVYGMDELDDYIENNNIDIAILTLPKEIAVDTAKHLAEKKIRGIWNFTGLDIDVDLGDTVVEEVHLADSLLNLGYYLRSHGEEED